MFEVSTTCHGMKGIQIESPTEAIRDFLRAEIANNRISTLGYKLKCNAGAFLQADGSEFIMVEFWLSDYQPFVDYLNKRWDENNDNYDDNLDNLECNVLSGAVEEKNDKKNEKGIDL